MNARIKIFNYKLSTQIFVQFNDLSGKVFLLLTRFFNVEITDDLFNFITASFSEMVESIALAFILTILGCLSKDLITDILGSRLPLAIGKDLGFGMFKVGTTLEKN